MVIKSHFCSVWHLPKSFGQQSSEATSFSPVLAALRDTGQNNQGFDKSNTAENGVIAGQNSYIFGIWEMKSRCRLVGKKLLQKGILTANMIMRFFSRFLIFHLLLYFNSASGHNSTSEVNNKLETLLCFYSFLLNCCITFTGSDERGKIWGISQVSLIIIRLLSEEQMT